MKGMVKGAMMFSEKGMKSKHDEMMDKESKSKSKKKKGKGNK